MHVQACTELLVAVGWFCVFVCIQAEPLFGQKFSCTHTIHTYGFSTKVFRLLFVDRW